MARAKLCSTCRTRNATMVRSFSGFTGGFFLCDTCDTPPTHAIPVIRRDEDTQRRKCDRCEVRDARVVRSFFGFVGTFYVCNECQVAPAWAVREEVRS